MTLTVAQREALDTRRSTVVVAGAGSGKTTVLVERYLATLRDGVPGRPHVTPAEVAAITFTDAAARHLKRKVAVATDFDVDDAPISTIHGFAARLLRTSVVGRAARMGSREFRVLSPLERRVFTRRVVEAWVDAAVRAPSAAVSRVAEEWDRATIVRMLDALATDRAATRRWLRAVGDSTPAAIEAAWRRAYPDFVEKEDAEEGARRLPVFAEATVALAIVVRAVLAAIEEEKARRDVVDHDDLLERLDRALDDEPVRRAMVERFAALLVDEYKDVDDTQRSILLKLVSALGGAARPGALFVVGDPKQAIYRFRGARPTAFADAIEWIGAGGSTVNLDTSFRSVEPLLSVLNTVTSRVFGAARDEGLEVPASQPLTAHRKDDVALACVLPEPVALFEVEKGGDEMRAVADWIDAARTRGVPLESIAILLRDRNRLTKLARALADVGVPARILAAGGFFRSAVARDFANLLSVIVDPADDIAFLGFLRGPLAGLSDDALALLATRGEKPSPGGPLRNRLLVAPREGLSDDDARALCATEANLTRWTALAALEPVRALLADVLRTTAAEVVYPAGDPEAVEHLSRLLRLVDASPDLSTQEFLALVRVNLRTLERDGDALDGAKTDAEAEMEAHAGVDAVSVLTIHAAKGLEFPIVIVPSLDRPIEHTIPRFKCVDVDTAAGPRTELLLARKEIFAIRGAVTAVERREEIAESLRVLYVALTRACDRLVLFYRAGGRRDSWARRLLPALEAAGVSPRVYPQPPPQEDSTPRRQGAKAQRQRPLPLASLRLGVSALKSCHPHRTVSPSTLHLLWECSLRYKYAVVLGIPEPRVATSFENPARVDPTVRGRVVHRAFERLRVDAGHGGSVASDATIDAILDENGVVHPSARTELRVLAIRAIALFRAADVGRRSLASPFQAHEVVVDYPFDGVIVRGAIDFAYGDPASGDFGVIDFKTDAVSAADATAFAASRGYDLQLALYALAVRDTFNARALDGHIIWTTPGCSTRVGFSPSDLDAALMRVRALLAPLKSGEFSAADSPPCERCGFGAAGICPSRR